MPHGIILTHQISFLLSVYVCHSNVQYKSQHTQNAYLIYYIYVGHTHACNIIQILSQCSIITYSSTPFERLPLLSDCILWLWWSQMPRPAGPGQP